MTVQYSPEIDAFLERVAEAKAAVPFAENSAAWNVYMSYLDNAESDMESIEAYMEFSAQTLASAAADAAAAEVAL